MFNPGDLPSGIYSDAQMFSQIVSFLVGALSAMAFSIAASHRG